MKPSDDFEEKDDRIQTLLNKIKIIPMELRNKIEEFNSSYTGAQVSLLKSVKTEFQVILESKRKIGSSLANRRLHPPRKHVSIKKLQPGQKNHTICSWHECG